jgi:tetratricopeptide (TPR) repeat protein
MKNKIFYLTALSFISLGEINSQSEGYAKYYNKANSLSENDFEKAEKNYRVAINDSLADLKATFNLSNEYYTEGYFEDAILRQLEAIKLAKNKIEKHKAFHNLGNSFMKKEMCSEAVSAYKSALRNNPNDDETRYNLALAKKCEDEQSQNDDDQKDDQQDKEKDNDKKDDQDQQKDNQGKDDEDQQKDNKGKDDPDQQKDKNKNSSEDSKPNENKKSQLSKQQINNLLKAMENAEKKVQAKVNESKQKGIKVISEKDW